MPIPKPKKNESKDEFISRCMSDDVMIGEYPQKQRYAVCLNQWEESKEKKSREDTMERRTFDAKELRAVDVDGKRKMVGYAAVFDKIGGNERFREKIAKGAFSDAIVNDDVRALINHDPSLILGRNRSGTLMMKEDDNGLYVEIDPPDTTYARDLAVSMERGDITQMSFGFKTIKDRWERADDGQQDIRTLEKVQLFDVSIVTYPFYENTDVALRSHEEWLKEKKVEEEQPEAMPKAEKPVNHILQVKKSYIGLKSKL